MSSANLPALPAIPVLCVVIAYVLVYVPHFIAGPARFKMKGGFDNNYPRDQAARLEGWAKRASAAHLNGHESFSPFAIAVVVAWLGGAGERTIAMLAMVYVALRVAYIAFYLANLAAVRSLAWIAGFGITIALFVLPLFS